MSILDSIANWFRGPQPRAKHVYTPAELTPHEVAIARHFNLTPKAWTQLNSHKRVQLRDLFYATRGL